jgi:hypothetical protein
MLCRVRSCLLRPIVSYGVLTDIRVRCLTCCAGYGAVCYDLLSLTVYLRPWMRWLWVRPLGSRPEGEDLIVPSPCCWTERRSVAQCRRFASRYGIVATWRRYTASARSIWEREVAVGEEICLFRVYSWGMRKKLRTRQIPFISSFQYSRAHLKEELRLMALWGILPPGSRTQQDEVAC